MATVFTKIIHGEIPAYKVAETADFLAFLDIHPLNEGHTLVIVKQEIDYVFDIHDDLFQSFFLFSKKVALAIEPVIECKRVGIAVVGLEVPHAHIHLVPLNTIYDIDFSKPKRQFTPEEFQSTAVKISQSFTSLFP